MQEPIIRDAFSTIALMQSPRIAQMRLRWSIERKDFPDRHWTRIWGFNCHTSSCEVSASGDTLSEALTSLAIALNELDERLISEAFDPYNMEHWTT